MSEKVLDAHGRWRNITVAFRVSPEEDELIERLLWRSVSFQPKTIRMV